VSNKLPVNLAKQDPGLNDNFMPSSGGRPSARRRQALTELATLPGRTAIPRRFIASRVPNWVGPEAWMLKPGDRQKRKRRKNADYSEQPDWQHGAAQAGPLAQDDPGPLGQFTPDAGFTRSCRGVSDRKLWLIEKAASP